MMDRLLDGLDAMSPRRFALLVVALFVTATAWAYSLGTSQPPETQEWTPQTQASAVPTEVDG